MPPYCPTCGQKLDYEQAEICPKCGVRIKAPPSQQSSGQKSPSIAAICSVFIPGLGQVYNGELEKGICIYIAELFGWALTIFVSFYLFILFPIIWIFGIYDAYTTAHQMNSNTIPTRSSSTSTMVIYIIGIFVVGFILSSMLMPMMLGGLAKGGSGGTDNPIVGEWKWKSGGIHNRISDGSEMVFYSDGTAKYLTSNYKSHNKLGTWEELEKDKIYQVSWDDGSTSSIERKGWPDECITAQDALDVQYYRIT